MVCTPLYLAMDGFENGLCGPEAILCLLTHGTDWNSIDYSNLPHSMRLIEQHPRVKSFALTSFARSKHNKETHLRKFNRSTDKT